MNISLESPPSLQISPSFNSIKFINQSKSFKMAPRFVILTLLVVGFAGVVLSAIQDDKRQNQVYKFADGQFCPLCELFVSQIKTQIKGVDLKPKLEQLCTMLGDGTVVERCKQAVNKYLDDLETKSAKDFCKEMALC